LYKPGFGISRLRRQMPHAYHDAGDTQQGKGEKWPMNLAVKWQLPRNLKDSLTCRKFSTWNRRLYFLSEGRHAEDFSP
jgi:hypothetical protein